MGINWDLVKVDWEMPVRAMLERGRQQQQANATAMQGNIASMRTQEDARQANMQNATAQQRMAQDQSQFNQTMDMNMSIQQQNADRQTQMDQYKMDQDQQDMDIRKQALSQKADNDNFNKVKSMMSLKIQADQAAGVLSARDKHQAWQQYVDSITKLGQDPMRLGLPLTYNKDAHDFLSSQLRSAVGGLGTKMQYGEAVRPKNPLNMSKQTPEEKYQFAANKEILQNDLQHINDGRKNIASFNNFTGQIPAIKQAAEDFDKYSLTGLSAAGDLGMKAAEYGANLSPNQSKAAAAGGVINQWGKTISLLKKSLMPGSMSDSDRELLMSLSVNTGMPKEEFHQKLGMIQGFMDRAVAEQSFKEAYLSQNGQLAGADQAWRRFMLEHPVVDSKTRQVTGDNDFRSYLMNQAIQNDTQEASQFNSGYDQPSQSTYNPTDQNGNSYNPYM